MLVLSRKLFERIQIGDEITVTVVAVRGGQVRIGISAPDDVRIQRSELLHKPATEKASKRPAQRAGTDADRTAKPPSHPEATVTPSTSAAGRTWTMRAPLARFTPKQAALAAIRATQSDVPDDAVERLFG
jgi:carbon storage regulator